MVWGCMGWCGVGQLAEIEGKIDADQFVSILEDHLLPSLEESGTPENQVTFNRTITQSTSQRRPRTGWKTTISLSLTVLHSLQT